VISDGAADAISRGRANGARSCSPSDGTTCKHGPYNESRQEYESPRTAAAWRILSRSFARAGLFCSSHNYRIMTGNFIALISNIGHHFCHFVVLLCLIRRVSKVCFVVSTRIVFIGIWYGSYLAPGHRTRGVPCEQWQLSP